VRKTIVVVRMGWSRNPVPVTQTEIIVWLECDGICGCMDLTYYGADGFGS